MKNACFGLCSFIFSLMLGVAPAWADVDISGKERVEVGTWSELKAAVEDSQNAGKVIVLTKDIQADKNIPITSAGGAGIIIDGGGFTITGQEASSNGQFIYFGSSDKTDLIIQNVKIEGFGTSTYGGAINNHGTIGDITGDFSDNYANIVGGAIANYGFIGNITGKFKDNSVSGVSYTLSAGGAIYNFNYSGGKPIGQINGLFSGNHAISEQTDSVGGAIYNGRMSIQSITGDFIENYVQSGASAYGGAIANGNNYHQDGTIGDIIGNFTGNYAQANNYAQGGAINNNGSKAEIGNITATFTGNYAKSDSAYAQGGAIYNDGKPLTLVNSSFYDNYVQTNAEKNSKYGQQTKGGAIYSDSDLTIKADDGESIFRGNKVKWANGEESSGIYMAKDTLTLTLDSRNNGLIQFDDKIISKAEIDDVFAQKFANANITNDGEGGYFIEQNGVTKHYKMKIK